MLISSLLTFVHVSLGGKGVSLPLPSYRVSTTVRCLYLPSPPPEEGGAVGKRGGGVGHFHLVHFNPVHLGPNVLCPFPPHCSSGGWQGAWLKGGV